MSLVQLVSISCLIWLLLVVLCSVCICSMLNLASLICSCSVYVPYLICMCSLFRLVSHIYSMLCSVWCVSFVSCSNIVCFLLYSIACIYSLFYLIAVTLTCCVQQNECSEQKFKCSYLNRSWIVMMILLLFVILLVCSLWVQ